MLLGRAVGMGGFRHACSVTPTLCDPMDCSPSGSSVQGILQAGILEWVAMISSKGSSQPRDQTCVSPALQVDSLPLSHWRSQGGFISSLRGLGGWGQVGWGDE